MSRRLVYVFLTLISAFFVVGLSQGWFNRHPASMHGAEIGTQSRTVPPTPHVSANISSSTSTLTHSQYKASAPYAEKVDASIGLKINSSARSVAINNANTDRNDASEKFINTSLSKDEESRSLHEQEDLDNSFIGQKVPISDSIQSNCNKEMELHGEGTPCSYLMPLLSKMAAEPREKVWASKMEDLLREYILADPVELKIRALECRQSLCVAEVVSNYGRLDIGERWGKNEPLWHGLFPDTAYVGREADPSGNDAIYGTKITVTVETFKRRNFEQKPTEGVISK